MRKNGLTIVELMIVLSILAILAVVAIPSYKRYRQTAVRNSMISFAEQLAVALVNSKAITGDSYPSFSASTGEIISTPIGKFRVPKDIHSVSVSLKNCNSSGVVLPGSPTIFEGFLIRIKPVSGEIPDLTWDSCNNSYAWVQN